jgi:hypothetical protein
LLQFSSNNLKVAMQINITRTKAIWPWLKEARFAWLSAAVISVALIVSLRPHTSEPTIRLTGLLLQLLGIGTVAWGISETRALFGHPSLASKIFRWLGRFPLRSRSITHSASISSFAFASSKVGGYVTSSAGSNPTIETRLDALEKNIGLIHNRIGSTEKEMNEQFREVTMALKNEQVERQSEDLTILKKLEATGTGGVHISAIGAAWLFVGVILSTAGLEIAEWLK